MPKRKRRARRPSSPAALRRAHLSRVEAATGSMSGYLYRSARRLQARAFRRIVAGLAQVPRFRAQAQDVDPAIQAELDRLIEEAVDAISAGLLGTAGRGARLGVKWFRWGSDPNQGFYADLARRLREALNKALGSRAALAGLMAVRYLDQGESQNEVYAKLMKEFGMGFYEVERIARTAVTGASGFAALKDIIAAGYKAKRWLATHDHRVRGRRPSDRHDHLHMDGQTVPVYRPFRDPRSGDEVMFPGDMTLGADYGMVVNCRCTIIGADIGDVAAPPPRKPARLRPGEDPLPDYGELNVDQERIEGLIEQLQWLARQYHQGDGGWWEQDVGRILFRGDWDPDTAARRFLETAEEKVRFTNPKVLDPAAGDGMIRARYVAMRRGLGVVDTLLGGRWKAVPSSPDTLSFHTQPVARAFFRDTEQYNFTPPPNVVVYAAYMPVSPNRIFRSTVHELGHFIESEWPGVSEKHTLPFLASRATGKLIPLRTVDPRYDAGEVFIDDAWVDPYVGKLYKIGNPDANWWFLGNPVATEVLSRGLEALFDFDTYMELMFADPEYLEVVLRTIQDLRAGRLWHRAGPAWSEEEYMRIKKAYDRLLSKLKEVP